MKKIITLFLLFSIFSSSVFAECDFKTGITKQVDGNYLYSKGCHVAVGQMKQDLDIANEQNLKFAKALELKDLALSKADQRADMWQSTAFKLEDRITKIDSMHSTNQWMMFGIGMVTMFGAAYAASQLIHR